MARCGTVWHGVARCGTVWHGVARCGTVWGMIIPKKRQTCGMGGYGRVWLGMVGYARVLEGLGAFEGGMGGY